MRHAGSAFLMLLFPLAVILPARPAAAGASPALARLLAGLPEDRIESGILYDRVLPLSRIEEHDGSPSSRPASLSEWRQMYSEIRRSCVREPSWPPLDVVAGHVPDAGVVPLAIMNFRYDRIRPDALASRALVRQGDALAFGQGDALVSGRAFAAAALRARTYRGAGVSFRLDRGDYFANDAAVPRRIEIDFDDGAGFVDVSFGREHRVAYASPGRKLVLVRASFADGSVLDASFPFDVLRLETPVPNDTLHVTASIPYLGQNGTGDGYVYLAEGHAALVNPVIVIEGFDLDNSMNWDELYALLNRENLLETLRSEGFDAVVLNFTDATDYMQRNAYVVEELISEVNAAVGAQSAPVMVGASMGGVLGRLALADMESRGEPHHIRTYISFDGPQAGADIPLGIQYWVAFFASDSPDAAALLTALDSPAARQLLVYHHTDPPGATGEQDPLRTQLLADLVAAGDWPALPRTVAIANGSGTQMDQGFNAGAQVVRWEYSSFLLTLTGDVWAVPDGGSATVFHGYIHVIFTSPDEEIVTVSGTQPYDNAPGGWRGSMAEMDSTSAPYGDIVALYPNHDFIPTVSSLDLDTQNLFYDVAGDADLLSHTPFDAVYFPQENQEHVLITPENAAWLEAEIVGSATSVAGGTVTAVPRVSPPAPNPAGAAAVVRFTVPAPGEARLAAYDAAGRRVAVLVDGRFGAGEHEAAWNGRNESGARLGAGVYFLRLEGRGFSAGSKIVVK